jgi:hypothetical protein
VRDLVQQNQMFRRYQLTVEANKDLTEENPMEAIRGQ